MVQKVKERVGWDTTDEYEIELRNQRALEEPMKVVAAIKGCKSIFQDYLVTRTGIKNPLTYKVELRSLTKRINTCSCPDFKKNFLGTCKHIKKVIKTIRKGKGQSSPYVDIFMYADPRKPGIAVPAKISPATNTFIGRYFDATGNFKQPEGNTVQVFLRDIESASPTVRREIRISSEIIDYKEEMLEKERLKQLSDAYAGKLREAAGQTSFLRYPLYDYQIDGMLHLAFTGRAMLADEMGLGKTVQAIAAAAVLREYFNIKRVLVVSPASLKTEWEEQIRKFTALPLEIVYGNRQTRIETYRKSNAFFLLANYEQVVKDYNEINNELRPDLVILDEAQRIKNWRTQTATCLKRLQSLFAFVLTGTPIENKIDEIYSLVEFINPAIFGSLFRFNRRFYHFGEEGKVDGVKNLRELHETVKQVMLRRRKDEINEQLPERIDNNYFVEMTKEQRLRYSEHEAIVVRLFNVAQRRPLLVPEFEKLQRALSCMRNLCDSVYIMDKSIKVAPKVDELMKILDDIWEDNPERKIIIFSEWVGMLELVEERLDELEIGYALHVGHIDQRKRRTEINRFKNDQSCRVFLSSDSGGVGLNLQTASVVVNLDLPWNPAKLEQRIARAWRKNQKNTVNVINLISSNTIEHKMLGTLEFKKGLADAVLDARGDISEFEKPNAKAAFMERLSKIMECDIPQPTVQPAEAKVPPKEQLAQELQLDNPGLGACSILYEKESGSLQAVFAVGNSGVNEKLNDKIEKTHGVRLPSDKMAVITPETHALLQQLAALGIITINSQKMTGIFETETFQPPRPPEKKLRLKMARGALSNAERKLKMSAVLKCGEFIEEAVLPARQAVLSGALALHAFAVKELPENAPVEFVPEMMELLKNNITFERSQLMFLQLCLHNLVDNNTEFLKNAEDFVRAVSEYVNKQALDA